jgi:hypothetical protein
MAIVSWQFVWERWRLTAKQDSNLLWSRGERFRNSSFPTNGVDRSWLLIDLCSGTLHPDLHDGLGPHASL